MHAEQACLWFYLLPYQRRLGLLVLCADCTGTDAVNRCVCPRWCGKRVAGVLRLVPARHVLMWTNRLILRTGFDCIICLSCGGAHKADI